MDGATEDLMDGEAVGRAEVGKGEVDCELHGYINRSKQPSNNAIPGLRRPSHTRLQEVEQRLAHPHRQNSQPNSVPECLFRCPQIKRPGNDREADTKERKS